jgi:hypothetical protein
MKPAGKRLAPRLTGLVFQNEKGFPIFTMIAVHSTAEWPAYFKLNANLNGAQAEAGRFWTACAR